MRLYSVSTYRLHYINKSEQKIPSGVATQSFWNSAWNVRSNPEILSPGVFETYE